MQEFFGSGNGLGITPYQHHTTLMKVSMQAQGLSEEAQKLNHQVDIHSIRLQKQDCVIRIQGDVVP
jgi:hypothetical protein